MPEQQLQIHVGLQKYTVIGLPCLTLPDNTERPETTIMGTNELVGTDRRKLKPYLNKLMAGEWEKGGEILL